MESISRNLFRTFEDVDQPPIQQGSPRITGSRLRKRFSRLFNFKFFALLAGFALLSIFLWQVDFHQLWNSLSKIGWKFLWVILVTSFGYWLSTYAWYLSFRSSNVPVSLFNLFVYRQIGETLSLINPASVLAGDTAKALMLRKHGINIEEGVSSVIISRALIAISLLMLLVFSSFFYLDALAEISSPVWEAILLIIIVSSSVGILFLSVSPQLYLYKLALFIRKKGFRFPGEKKTRQIRQINHSLAVYFARHKGKLFAALSLSCLHWLMGATEFYLILRLLDIPVTITGAIMLEMGVMLIKAMGAFVPGQIGIEEYGNKLMLGIIGFSVGGIWVVVSVIRRARQLFWLGVGCLFFLWKYKKL